MCLTVKPIMRGLIMHNVTPAKMDFSGKECEQIQQQKENKDSRHHMFTLEIG